MNARNGELAAFAMIFLACKNLNLVTDKDIDTALDTAERINARADQRYKDSLTSEEREHYEKHGY